ncbi:MAG: GNAT family N-acetyltransferase [Clostridia bacterium]|nr:GNAT family N-acetyltransferase [Clostridia bacterium]
MTKQDLKLFIDPPILITERLKLRKFGKSDLFDVYKYARSPSVTKYLLWSPHPSIDHTKKYLSFIEKKYLRGEFYDWGIEYKGEMIGTVGFTRLNCEDNEGEVGFVLREDKWGMGLASEAAEAVIRFGFEVLGLHRIEARCMEENEQSASVLIKCKMKYEGTLREAVFTKGLYVNVKVFSIIDKEYFS